jgi:hypothetical protein
MEKAGRGPVFYLEYPPDIPRRRGPEAGDGRAAFVALVAVEAVRQNLVAVALDNCAYLARVVTFYRLSQAVAWVGLEGTDLVSGVLVFSLVHP